MLNTYQAILRGKIVEWLADQPENLTPDRPISVYVTVLDESSTDSVAERKARMAAALDALARAHGDLSSLDPLQWQQEVRQDRSLPGRTADAS